MTQDFERAPGSPEKPAGQDAQRNKLKPDYLAERKPQSLYERYARELPIEYRELLESYYETLAKEGSRRK